ncbi:small-conductance mechanosensitive channel [Caldisphaera lagunensis DSM 15908]|uniref:Small-conductance mechanosensitive channel n=1 Tax=Caldisphaera lagunensis (strain DSM 15908 / JCM 11604 / ANMR 0165 / IC-154) TaxID=1056495 RepID=L0A7Z2_CALLD|nr:MFS transporter [Caldisphaera lagunensis]AFZ69951.1 small-conductance mechanosensitive channel [Caldisphaera lagunensis DSM 15908]
MIKKEVYKLSFSAFFADLGYQTAVVMFPLIFVIILKAPIWLYGIAEALNYGIGSLMGLIGGIMGDKFGRKKMAVLGNGLIIIISLLGFSKNLWEALLLFMIPWWFRNFRSPIRRAMLTEVTEESERSKAFGILHSLDLGGAVLAITYTTILLFFKFPIQYLLLITMVPLAISTYLLSISNSGKKVEKRKISFKSDNKIITLIVISTTLFGFTQYSFGFPIITTEFFTHQAYLSVISYGIFLSASSLFGFLLGRLRINNFFALGFIGYLLGSFSSLGFAQFSSYGIMAIYPFSFLLGVSIASTETFEPSIISRFSKSESMGSNMGLLTFGRSIGVFLSNMIMGLLYEIRYSYAYYFSSIMSIIAFIIVLYIIFKMRINK